MILPHRFELGDAIQRAEWCQGMEVAVKKMMLWIIAVATLSGSTLCAQDIAGDWQGTLKAGAGLRLILHITKSDNGGWSAMLYSIDQGPAIKDALFGWQREGIRSVTVMQDTCCGSASTIALVEKCLRDAAIPHAFAKIESWRLEETLLPAQQITRGIIFPSSALAAALAARDPARFAKLSKRSRVLLMDGPIDVPGLYAVEPSSDVIQVDLQSIAKRIVSDLIQSSSRRAEPATFQAKWVPRAINHLATPHSIQPRCNAQAHRLGGS